MVPSTSTPSLASETYLLACKREGTECVLEFLNALSANAREVALTQRSVPLTDADVICIAEALRTPKHSLRVLNLEENNFGLTGVQALIEALVSNPGCLRELRLGKNRLKDPTAVVIGNALSLAGCGIKVLDLSENFITKLGVMAITQAVCSTKVCDVVELSLHNNALESDAALPLAQAVRQSTKLRHLHLGYNSLRDSGALQLARAIPLAASLATLDLTANRIGPQGGIELARSLMSPSCTLQRLNLRHNALDDSAFAVIADALVQNTSLTQLFLGFTKPSVATATHVVEAALRHNHTLVLLDVFGWPLESEATDVVCSWLREPSTGDDQTGTGGGHGGNFSSPLPNAASERPRSSMRSLISDAFEDPAGSRLIANLIHERHQRGWSKVYVGPDDRLAYQAAAAAKTGRAGTLGNDTTPESTVPRGPTPVPVPSMSRSGSQGGGSMLTPPSTKPIVSFGARNGPAGELTPPLPSSTLAKEEFASLAGAAGNGPFGGTDVESLLGELQSVHMDAELRRKLVRIITQLQFKIDTVRSYHQQQIVALEDRVRTLELHSNGHATGTRPVTQHPSPLESSSTAFGVPVRSQSPSETSSTSAAVPQMPPPPMSRPVTTHAPLAQQQDDVLAQERHAASRSPQRIPVATAPRSQTGVPLPLSPRQSVAGSASLSRSHSTSRGPHAGDPLHGDIPTPPTSRPSSAQPQLHTSPQRTKDGVSRSPNRPAAQEAPDVHAAGTPVPAAVGTTVPPRSASSPSPPRRHPTPSDHNASTERVALPSVPLVASRNSDDGAPRMVNRLSNAGGGRGPLSRSASASAFVPPSPTPTSLWNSRLAADRSFSAAPEVSVTATPHSTSYLERSAPRVSLDDSAAAATGQQHGGGSRRPVIEASPMQQDRPTRKAPRVLQ